MPPLIRALSDKKAEVAAAAISALLDLTGEAEIKTKKEWKKWWRRSRKQPNQICKFEKHNIEERVDY